MVLMFDSIKKMKVVQIFYPQFPVPTFKETYSFELEEVQKNYNWVS